MYKKNKPQNCGGKMNPHFQFTLSGIQFQFITWRHSLNGTIYEVGFFRLLVHAKGPKFVYFSDFLHKDYQLKILNRLNSFLIHCLENRTTNKGEELFGGIIRRQQKANEKLKIIVATSWQWC
jgi:hypothetical protein